MRQKTIGLFELAEEEDGTTGRRDGRSSHECSVVKVIVARVVKLFMRMYKSEQCSCGAVLEDKCWYRAGTRAMNHLETESLSGHAEV